MTATRPLFQVIDATLEIVAITGGRWVHPTRASLIAFTKWLRFNDIRTLVHGDCKSGVDRLVSQWVIAETDIRVEPWPALWGRYKKPAGPIRNGRMLIGDRRDWGGEHLHRPVHALIAWPGNEGTKDCCDQAESLGIDVLQIADVERQVREREAAA